MAKKLRIPFHSLNATHDDQLSTIYLLKVLKYQDSQISPFVKQNSMLTLKTINL